MFSVRQTRNLLPKYQCYYSTATSREEFESIIRVDHAGELGADRIYAGQMAVLGNTAKGPLIQHMWDQEKRHRAKFEELIRKYRVRPTVMVPIWNVAGFALGAGINYIIHLVCIDKTNLKEIVNSKYSWLNYCKDETFIFRLCHIQTISFVKTEIRS